MSELPKCVITRSKWDRRVIESGSISYGKLASPNGYCCLGFLSLQCLELSEEQIVFADEPSSVAGELWRGWHSDAIDINDSPDPEYNSSEEQEQALVELFAENGYDLSFED